MLNMLKSTSSAFPSNSSKLLNASADTSCKTVFARRMVVLSAGSLSTPQILERSGIGSSIRFSILGIGSVVDLPGVGENYQDHNRLPAGVARIEGSLDDTADLFLRAVPETVSRWEAEYATGQGPMAWNFVDAGGKFNPSTVELEQMGPDFQRVWHDHFVERPDKSTITIAVAALYSPQGYCTYLTQGFQIMSAPSLQKDSISTSVYGIITL